jgi:ribosomal protein S12 methylthiotransferase
VKTKGTKKTKVNIVTLGCSKNLVDSEVLLTQLRGNGIDTQHESKKDDSNIVVINTCGFIDNAKQESIDTILRYVDAKEEGVVEKVYVTGCLSERYKDDLQKEIPKVDAWFGTRDLSRLLKQLNANYKHELVGERILTNPSHFAYLKNFGGLRSPVFFLCYSHHARQTYFKTDGRVGVGSKKSRQERNERVTAYCTGFNLLWSRYLQEEKSGRTFTTTFGCRRH